MKTNIALVIAYAAILIIGFAQADDVDTTSTEQICLPDDNTCVADLGRDTQEASIGTDNLKIKEGIHITNGDDDDDDDDDGDGDDGDDDDDGDGDGDDDDDDDDDDEYDDGSVPSKEDSYYDHDDDDDYDFEDEDGVDSCHDEHERCEFWASLNECEKNPGYMLGNCQKSCDTCTKSSPSTVKEGYGAAYGEPQECSGQHKDAMLERVNTMDKYMSEEVIKPEFDNVRDECKNRNALCLFWAHIGECENNPAFMLINCAPSCETCKNIDFNYRCPADPDAKNVFGPGDLHKMFERIVDQNDNVTVLSQPPTEEGATFRPWVSPHHCHR